MTADQAPSDLATIISVTIATLGMAATLTGVALAERRGRRIRYLAALAGPRDLWDVPCHNCGRRVRDEATITRATTTPDGSGAVTVRRVYHADRSACATAANHTTTEETQ